MEVCGNVACTSVESVGSWMVASDTIYLDAVLYRRNKDIVTEGPVGEWMKEFVKNQPWYKNVVPKVRIVLLTPSTHILLNPHTCPLL